MNAVKKSWRKQNTRQNEDAKLNTMRLITAVRLVCVVYTMYLCISKKNAWFLLFKNIFNKFFFSSLNNMLCAIYVIYYQLFLILIIYCIVSYMYRTQHIFRTMFGIMVNIFLYWLAPPQQNVCWFDFCIHNLYLVYCEPHVVCVRVYLCLLLYLVMRARLIKHLPSSHLVVHMLVRISHIFRIIVFAKIDLCVWCRWDEQWRRDTNAIPLNTLLYTITYYSYTQNTIWPMVLVEPWSLRCLQCFFQTVWAHNVVVVVIIVKQMI